MTAIQALKELAYKVTGKTPKSNTENGVITEFANDYGNGSSGLFFFNIAYNTVQGGFIADKTFAEIKNAINAKKVAVGMSGAMAIYVTDSGTAGPSRVILDGASGGSLFNAQGSPDDYPLFSRAQPEYPVKHIHFTWDPGTGKYTGDATVRQIYEWFAESKYIVYSNDLDYSVVHKQYFYWWVSGAIHVESEDNFVIVMNSYKPSGNKIYSATLPGDSYIEFVARDD